MNMKPEIQQLMINVQQYHMNKFNEILCYKCITQKQEEWNIPCSTIYILHPLYCSSYVKMLVPWGVDLERVQYMHMKMFVLFYYILFYLFIMIIF